jgi:hypothetical protein
LRIPRDDRDMCRTTKRTPNMGKQSTPAPIPQPKFDDSPNRMGTPPRKGK